MIEDLDPRLVETLGIAQRFGFLGAAPIESVITHARQFIVALPSDAHRVVDVGSGGGVPGLVIAVERADLQVVLTDRMTRRTDFLARAVTGLGLSERVVVLPGDAAALSWEAQWRGQFDAAVARGLGAPPITAELCRGFVREGGVLVVSEPPDGAGGSRWNASGLARLGWQAADLVFPGVIRFHATGSAPPPDVPRRGKFAPRW